MSFCRFLINILFFLLMSCNLKDNKKLVLEKYKDGSIRLECDMNNGKIIGSCNGYYENGNLKHIANYKNDTLNGESTFFHKNGRINWKVNFINGKKNGVVTYYDSAGVKVQIVSYKDGVFHGKWYTFFPNGNTKTIENFINGVKVDTSVTFTTEGKVEKIAIYDVRGDFKKLIKFDAEGNPVEIGLHLDFTAKSFNGKQNGVITLENPMHDALGVVIGEYDEVEDIFIDTALQLFSEDFRVQFEYLNSKVKERPILEGVAYDLQIIDAKRVIPKRRMFFRIDLVKKSLSSISN